MGDSERESAEKAAAARRAREHMREWAQRLVNGELKRDPVEDTGEEVWRSLVVFANQYVELNSENDRLRLAVDHALHVLSYADNDDEAADAAVKTLLKARAHTDGTRADG